MSSKKREENEVLALETSVKNLQVVNGELEELVASGVIIPHKEIEVLTQVMDLMASSSRLGILDSAVALSKLTATLRDLLKEK